MANSAGCSMSAPTHFIEKQHQGSPGEELKQQRIFRQHFRTFRTLRNFSTCRVDESVFAIPMEEDIVGSDRVVFGKRWFGPALD